MSEALDAYIWREHEGWLRDRPRRWAERERWTDADWLAARSAADAAWDAHPRGLYLYAAERALREQQYRRAEARFAYEASHGVEWLLGVLERTRAREPSPSTARPKPKGDRDENRAELRDRRAR